MSLFVCPVCAGEFEREGMSLVCDKRHTFDVSKTGAVNLVLSNGKKAVYHGDGVEMVRARRDFLEKGYYKVLADSVANTALKYALCDSVYYFDAGCGTGYYTEKVINALSQNHTVFSAGVDISKEAVRISSKAVKECEFAVASVYSLPVKSETFDIVTNIFSPQAEGEYARILKKGGVLLYAVPAREHLYSMKKVLYENPYENEEKEVEYEGFELVERVDAKDLIHIEGEEIQNLFSMTPYFWRTSKEGTARLLETKSLDVEISFYVYVYKKV